ncbi:hypothetical protein T265_07813 [Opisthorchis viverrini]|uniref:Uncharacterized protein n=1 Tax=Opisthorchis viverrini TaxID=6198 RepID=A0A074ZFW6_OPIVI|nr:hypothetical protein T265_07813 [Opisthorchis viverrini]KER24542.1 hypothetical protein T265_07813 [Opisthorchis viverrini]
MNTRCSQLPEQLEPALGNQSDRPGFLVEFMGCLDCWLTKDNTSFSTVLLKQTTVVTYTTTHPAVITRCSSATLGKLPPNNWTDYYWQAKPTCQTENRTRPVEAL